MYPSVMEELKLHGAIREARKLLRLVGGDAFGEPDARTAAAIEGLDDLVCLENLVRWARSVGSWKELLGMLAPGRWRRAAENPWTKDSPAYRLLMETGEIDGAISEAKKLLRLLGDAAFGPPDSQTAAVIERLEDLRPLEALLKRVRTASSWQEVLGLEAPRRRDGRQRRT